MKKSILAIVFVLLCFSGSGCRTTNIVVTGEFEHRGAKVSFALK